MRECQLVYASLLDPLELRKESFFPVAGNDAVEEEVLVEGKGGPKRWAR